MRPVLELVPQGQIPRTEFKARRVIDDRDLYKRGSGPMFDKDAIARAAARRREWEATGCGSSRPPTGGQDGIPDAVRAALKRVYTAEDVADLPFDAVGLPGQYPFTRGPYPTMYRGRLWTMRQIAGFGTGEDTNRRFRY